MKTEKTQGFVLALALGIGLMLIVLTLLGGQARAGDPTPPTEPSKSELSSHPSPPGESRIGREHTQPVALASAAAGDVIEVFTNTWSYSTIGLVWDPGRQHARYAHESQSSTSNPTIYDVDVASHTALFSVALSAQNGGWPWQLDNRTGAGYDFVEDTYFLPDYNGDLSYADDNIVEIDPDGNILNVWEMDDEVGSNDSTDGSEIDSIIDIAVVPGSPTRYFATAAYDGGLVYEIVLTKTGTWWMPDSWYTVMTYTGAISDTFADNLGIDYDAQNEMLYHSGWHTTTILVTDLNMNPITEISPSFDCPGAGGYNSGVTFIEGSEPPEIWATDFSSDQTTRCKAIGAQPIEPGWDKWVAGRAWDADLNVITQTNQIVQVTDVITAIQRFTLTETWDPDQLALIEWGVFPPIATAITETGALDLVGPAGPPEVVTITKWFRVKPCDWITTTLEEELEIEGAPSFGVRPFIITKQQPNLQIDSAYDEEVYAGSITSFTLSYSNTGGFETDVWIRNTFPITAPFVYAEPFPSHVGPDGLWARWDVGDLAQDDVASIDVYVFISETVAPSSTITIWDGIFNHMDVLQYETWIDFHANQVSFPVDWEKLINGEPWHPGISVTLETSQTLAIEEFIDPQGNPTGFSLIEEWNPEELALSPSWTVEPITYRTYITASMPGLWTLVVPPSVDYGPLTIVKEFNIEPCIWPETVLWESLQVWSGGLRNRPLVVGKQQPDLWIDSFFEEGVYSGDEAQFVLRYGNTGGLESQAWITNTFPPEVTFVRSEPSSPITEDPNGRWATWDAGALATDQEDRITVTVAITEGLPPSTTIEFWDSIHNHIGEPVDETPVIYQVLPPTWEKQVNDEPWRSDLGVSVQTSDTITVTDVISSHSAVAMVEHWNPEHLTLSRFITQSTAAGKILSNTDSLSWEFPEGAPGTMIITKIFHVEPCTWTYTVLWEELWVEDVEWQRRPVHIAKRPSELWIDSTHEPNVIAGHEATFTLSYGNVGGLESQARVTNTFPPEATFVRSEPSSPTDEDLNGRWATWDVGALATGEEGRITITVAITEDLAIGSLIHIYDYIHDHVDVERDWTVVTYKYGSSIYLPLMLRDFGHE